MLSRTEARGVAEFRCFRCSSVNTIPQCHDDNFTPDTLLTSVVVHLKRLPKISQFPLAETLIPKNNIICETPSNTALCCLLHSSLCCFLEKPRGGGKRQRSSLSAIINRSIWDGVLENKTKRDRKPQQKTS